uniref:Uncharacterized protein n=1 Tax=Parascaris equorum TaxID=6256 RepID=A0A914RGT4_PAREQ
MMLYLIATVNLLLVCEVGRRRAEDRVIRRPDL